MALAIPYCYGREYPRRPRGESPGCLNDNWPARWERVSGPSPTGLWNVFLLHQLVYSFTDDLDDTLFARWQWDGSAFGRSVRLYCSNNNPQQTVWYWKLSIHRPSFGAVEWISDGMPWGNYGEITLNYQGGFTSEWSDLESPWVIRRSEYSDLPANFCTVSL